MFSATRKVDNAATKSLTDTISAMEDDKQITDFCKAQYSACMDNFCNVLDDAQGRCSCSKNIKNYAKSEEALKQANELLQDVAQQIQYIGLTRDEVETLFTQTAAEQAMQGVTDNSQIKTQLDKIYDMMVDVKPGTATATDTTDTGLALDLNNLLDFTFDSTGFDLLSMFSPSEQSSSISNQRGEQLYKTAASRCKATVLDACRSQGVDVTLITNSYDLEIDKSCVAYERSLTDGNAEMRQTVRNAQNVLQRARLMVRQQKNTYDLRGCVTALDACMQDEFVCGADYENCLDPSGKYIVNGEVVIGSTPGQPVLDGYYLQPGYQYDTSHLYSTWNYKWNYGDTNAWLPDGSLVDYIEETVKDDPKTTSEDMSAFLQYKIGYHDDETDRNYGMCMSVLNKCQDLTYNREGEYEPNNNVIREYLQRTMTQIKVRQDAILAAYAESCIPDVKSCLSQNGYATTPNIAINACRQQVVTCMSVTGDANGEPTPPIISEWVDDVQNGITERKQCERSGGTYNASTGKCSCSASLGLRLTTAGISCECTNGGTWRDGSCYVAPTKCGLNQMVSGCTCDNKVITEDSGVKWCVNTSTQNAYTSCTTGSVRGEWNMVNMVCNCPSNSGGLNGKCTCNSGYETDGNGGCAKMPEEPSEPSEPVVRECGMNAPVSNCECLKSSITVNGTEYCVTDITYKRYQNCTTGSVRGEWDFETYTCDCPDESMTSNGDYACKCAENYKSDNAGGCIKNESGGDEGEEPEIINPYVAVSSSTPMEPQSVVTDTDSNRDILIVSDTDTGALYANVADEDGEYGTSAADACVISDASQATATVCDEDNTVTLNSGGMVAVYAVRSGGISLRFNNEEVQTLKLALEDRQLPKRIDWLSTFAKKQDYTLSGVYGSDKTTVYYDANGDRTISAAPADKQLYALFVPADTPSDNETACTESGGTWSNGACTCPGTHTLTDGKCVKNGGDDAGTCAVNGRKTDDCECPENTGEYPIDSVTYCFEDVVYEAFEAGYKEFGYTWNFEKDSFDCPENSTCRAFPGEETRCMMCDCNEGFTFNSDTAQCVGQTEQQISCEKSGGVFDPGNPGHYTSTCYCSGITDRIVYSDHTKCIETNFAQWCITQNETDKYNEDLSMCVDSYDNPYWFEAYARDGKTAEQACVWAGGQFDADPYIFLPTIHGATVHNMDTCICGGESGGKFFAYDKNMTRKYNRITGRCECRPTYEMQTDANSNMTGCGCPDGKIQYKAKVVAGNGGTTGFEDAYATLGGEYAAYELKGGDTVPVPVTRDWKIYETTSIWPNQYLLDDAGNRINMECVLFVGDPKNNRTYQCLSNLCVLETTAEKICVASSGEWDSATDTCACYENGYTAHESGMSCQCVDGWEHNVETGKCENPKNVMQDAYRQVNPNTTMTLKKVIENNNGRNWAIFEDTVNIAGKGHKVCYRTRYYENDTYSPLASEATVVDCDDHYNDYHGNARVLTLKKSKPDNVVISKDINFVFNGAVVDSLAFESYDMSWAQWYFTYGSDYYLKVNIGEKCSLNDCYSVLTGGWLAQTGCTDECNNHYVVTLEYDEDNHNCHATNGTLCANLKELNGQSNVTWCFGDDMPPRGTDVLEYEYCKCPNGGFEVTNTSTTFPGCSTGDTGGTEGGDDTGNDS